MLVRLYDKNPNPRELAKVTDVLNKGGIIIYPTDSVYAFGCKLTAIAGIERITKLAGKDESMLTIICSSISQAAEYARIDNAQFKVLKRNTPGPFTFILNASSSISDRVLAKRKTVGIRIPDSTIAQAIIEDVGMPLFTTSVKDPDSIVEYTTDPDLIWERYSHKVDALVSADYGQDIPTTIVDLTDGEPEIVRQGIGELR
ncbi:MAG: threonylcarbamoyl-AMP synthase [Rikenellaceae bacterium]|nr:threonylcarbamoyl-AMP synthase [Rikenellaceae bacterium]